jgi:H+/Cl- antiporter ClcA
MAVAVAATMSGAMVATMKAPLFTALFVAALGQREAYPVIATALIAGLLATMKFSLVPRPKAGENGGKEQGQVYPGPE